MRTERVEQAGGVAFRGRGPDLELLLVRSKKNPSIWVFPKGHIEPGETAPAAALRETREEAGVDGELIGPVGDPLEFDSGSEPVRVQYYLIRATGAVPSPERRELCWARPSRIRELLSFDNARAVLDAEMAAIASLAARPPAQP